MDRAEWVKSALERFEGPLIRYAAGITGDVEQARDVVQDTFLKLCGAKRESVNGRLSAWLYTVCRNRALDVWRREKRRARVETANARDGVFEHPAFEPEEPYASVLRLIGTLPENQREALRLKYQDGLSYKEISQVTGLSVSNVGFLIHSGVKRVREQINVRGDLIILEKQGNG